MGHSRLGIVVPSSSERQQILNACLSQLNTERFAVVVVGTSPGVSVRRGVDLVEDFGAINIQRWWNKGLSHLLDLGCDIGIVMNDDVYVTSDQLELLGDILARSRATVASPGQKLRWYRRGLPLSWHLDGSLWALNLHQGLRPDEKYHWWMGDRDIEVRARSSFGGLLTVPIEYTHVPGQATSAREDLKVLATRDMSLFGEEHAAVVRLMKYKAKLRSFLL